MIRSMDSYDFDDDDLASAIPISTSTSTSTSAPASSSRPSAPPPSRAPQPRPSGPQPPKIQQPVPQALPSRSGPSSILVAARQKGNPILAHIKSHAWEWADIPADFVLGATTCALFLSLKYHKLHPEYIYGRVRDLGPHRYDLRVLLTLVDIPAHEEALQELAKTCLVNSLTLLLAWSAPEAGRYLELYKTLEHAQPSAIQQHQTTGYTDKLKEFVTVPRPINKPDALSLLTNFGSLKAAVNAEPQDVAMIGGWGEKKVVAWCRTVREPFRTEKAAKRQLANPREALSHGKVRREDDSGAETMREKAKMPEWDPYASSDDDDDDEGGAADEASRPAPVASKPAQERRILKEPKLAAPTPDPARKVVDDDLDDGVGAALAALRNR